MGEGICSKGMYYRELRYTETWWSRRSVDVLVFHSHQLHRFVLLYFDDNLVLEEVGAMTYQLKLNFGLIYPLSICLFSVQTKQTKTVIHRRESWHDGHVALAVCGHALTVFDWIRTCFIQHTATDNLSQPQ